MASSSFTDYGPLGLGASAQKYGPLGLGQTGTSGYGADPNTLGTDSASSNLASSPYTIPLTDLVNATNQAAQQSALGGRIPGAPALEAQSSQNIQADLAGQLTPAEQAFMQNNVAAGGAAGGFGVDSPNLSSSYAVQNLLGMQNRRLQGQQELSAAYARNPIAPVVGMQNYLVDPGLYASTAHNQAALALSANRGSAGGGGGGGGVRTAAAYNSGSAVPYGGGYPGAGGGGGAAVTDPYADPFASAFDTTSQNYIPDPWGQGFNDLGTEYGAAPAPAPVSGGDPFAEGGALYG